MKKHNSASQTESLVIDRRLDQTSVPMSSLGSDLGSERAVGCLDQLDVTVSCHTYHKWSLKPHEKLEEKLNEALLGLNRLGLLASLSGASVHQKVTWIQWTLWEAVNADRTGWEVEAGRSASVPGWWSRNPSNEGDRDQSEGWVGGQRVTTMEERGLILFPIQSWGMSPCCRTSGTRLGACGNTGTLFLTLSPWLDESLHKRNL